MSELIHRKDRGIMIPDRFRNILKCSKCAVLKFIKNIFILNMSKEFWKYQYKKDTLS